jgi:hypothetical protein
VKAEGTRMIWDYNIYINPTEMGYEYGGGDGTGSGLCSVMMYGGGIVETYGSTTRNVLTWLDDDDEEEKDEKQQ